MPNGNQQTLAQMVRAKYPGAYDDMDDAALEKNVLAKYPQYADLPRTNGQDGVTFKSPTTGKIQPVPQEHWDEALKQGYTPVSHVVMYDKNDQRGMVPREQMADYVRQGYQTAPKTQFEKDRPGKGISLEGSGSAFLSGLERMLPEDPTGGHSLFSSEGWIGDKGPITFDPKNSGLAEAGREAAAGWQRGGDPRAKLGEAVSSGAGSLLGVSGRRFAELGSQGRGGEIIGETAAAEIPAVAALAAPAIAKGVGEVRPALQRAVYRELPTGGAPQLTKGARFASGIAGGSAGGVLGHASGVPGMGYMGGHLGLLGGPSLLETIAGTPELGDIRNPGPFGKIPVRAPRTAPPVPPSPFEGMTSSAKPLGSAELPSSGARTSVLGAQPKVEMVSKFTPPEPSRIVTPESAPRPYKVTYQSVPQRELFGKMMQGDTEAVREWQRRGLELPLNVRYLTEGNAPSLPWRNYEEP